MNNFPSSTAVALKMDKLLRSEKKLEINEHLSTRMVQCAASLKPDEFLGWQMHVPVKGAVHMSLFGSTSLGEDDLKWIAEKTAKTKKIKQTASSAVKALEMLYELQLPRRQDVHKLTVGFDCSGHDKKNDGPSRLPMYYSSEFSELVRAFQRSGAFLRVVFGCASEDEQRRCREEVLDQWTSSSTELDAYVDRPVRARILIRLPGTPSVRLISVLNTSIPGIELALLGRMEDEACIHAWEEPLSTPVILPDYAARIMTLEPQLSESMIGIEVCDEPPKPIPASHKNPKSDKAVVIGTATDTTGTKRKISIGELDLRRHYQIVGQTGCGKSTLLASLILSAIERGHGLTFFDPHGTTIDVVLRSLPAEYADRVRVVRIGDAENPVPLNIWDSDDPEKEERNISDLCELFADIFDPKREGFVGPRYERWLSTFAKTSIAFLGRRASLESIAVISQSQDNMLKVARVIAPKYPHLFETIKEEYGKDKSSDFQNILNWYLCKFQRLTSVEQLRKTLGAGTNALDFKNSIDTDTVTLIDLASPQIGTHAARIVGTMILMKLWSAAMARKERDRTHMVVVDEAALFQTNPMPRMLAEARKFGISMVLCHQHTGQLTQEIRDALEANSANFSAFRLSPKDAYTAAIRFDNEDMRTSLTRLDAFNCITTLSVNGQQTAPFTMRTIRPKVQKRGDEIAAEIEQRSIDTLVKPFDAYRALTATDIQDLLNHPEKLEDLELHAKSAGEKSPGSKSTKQKPSPQPKQVPDWLQQWIQEQPVNAKAG